MAHRRKPQAHTTKETQKQRLARLKEAQERRAQQRAQSTGVVVYPFKEWCLIRGISEPTGRRLIRAGKVRVTRLSKRRVGIRSDHDAEYLDACGGA
jgi:hypothetical protein